MSEPHWYEWELRVRFAVPAGADPDSTAAGVADRAGDALMEHLMDDPLVVDLIVSGTGPRRDLLDGYVAPDEPVDDPTPAGPGVSDQPDQGGPPAGLRFVHEDQPGHGFHVSPPDA